MYQIIVQNLDGTGSVELVKVVDFRVENTIAICTFEDGSKAVYNLRAVRAMQAVPMVVEEPTPEA